MTIPESQLETWSHQGSVKQSSDTYNTIKNVLEATSTPYASKNYSVFLQGSYGNDTNIYAESDVDIVIKLDDCMQSDLTALPQDEKDAYYDTFPNAIYTHADFKRDVIKVLTDKYGADVKADNKAIKIAASESRRKADVIVAIQFRRYHKFKSVYDQSYDGGICFFNATGERITNYPKQHSENLTRKHQNANMWVKPMARIFKNLRGALVDGGHIKAGSAPSYFIEGLIYNVPNDRFTTSYQDCFIKAINWLNREADKDKMVCANEQYYLLRENTHTSWSKIDCENFLKAAIKLWKDW